MALRFIHPPLDGPVTGGTRYNQNLIRAAERVGMRLHSVEWPGQTNIIELLAPFDPQHDVLLWDSLFLSDLAEAPDLGGWPRQGLLVHYLPFANPMLDEPERAHWRRQFQRVAQGMRFLVATGARVADGLRRQFPKCEVFLREPEVDPAFHPWRGRSRVADLMGPVRLITVANLLPAKRQRELLEMLAPIDADWEWHLAGEAGLDPGYADGLRARIRQLGLTRQVVWHGSLPPDELAGLMASMDLFVCYSAFESYGMVLAEAAAVGLPILTTGVGEAERLVENGRSGVVIPVDRADLFEQALSRLLKDGDFRRSLEVRPSTPSSETV
ncbi:MAG: glycosyltransferase [Methylococcus sp.]|nr:MAG: glycosyltransferase [Methylococcus sp.]